MVLSLQRNVYLKDTALAGLMKETHPSLPLSGQWGGKQTHQADSKIVT